MLYRCLRRRDTGQWLNVLLTTGGGSFSTPELSHRTDIAKALGLVPDQLEVVDAPADSRTGVLLALPVPVLPPDPAIAIAAAAADVVTEIDKAFIARTTPLTAGEKTAIRDKVVSLIGRAQGR